MNKLILVGNGFDLAHGLRTSYKDFIDDFWKNLIPKLDFYIEQSILEVDQAFRRKLELKKPPFTCFFDFVQYLKNPNNIASYNLIEHDISVENNAKTKKVFTVKNQLLRIISQDSTQNWVDIENEYYKLLRGIVENSNHSQTFNGGIESLNNEFSVIKKLLESYLKEKIVESFDFKKNPENHKDILNLFRVRGKILDLADPIFMEFPIEDHDDLVTFNQLLIENPYQQFHENLFLDFNYTPTVEYYVNEINKKSLENYGSAELIKIHGEVNSNPNPINFGFGDEMDEAYKTIENKDDNRYLENIKSFKYLHNSNYRKLLNWIEANKFQVYVFGHSCGLSDRTLLNTIFEHKNCRSIKIFYHNDNKKDNYTELTNNISRHFDKKKMMREKVVDKTNCIELPQKVRFRSNN